MTPQVSSLTQTNDTEQQQMTAEVCGRTQTGEYTRENNLGTEVNVLVVNERK